MCSFKTCSCTASVNCHDTAITTVVVIANDYNYKMLISMMYCNTELMVDWWWIICLQEKYLWLIKNNITDPEMRCHGPSLKSSSLQTVYTRIKTLLQYYMPTQFKFVPYHAACSSEWWCSLTLPHPVPHRGKGSGTWPQSGLLPRNSISHLILVAKGRLVTFLHSRIHYQWCSSS